METVFPFMAGEDRWILIYTTFEMFFDDILYDLDYDDSILHSYWRKPNNKLQKVQAEMHKHTETNWIVGAIPLTSVGLRQEVKLSLSII